MKNVELTILGVDSIDMIMEFDKLCFPTDFWKAEDWKSLLTDERTVYYAFMDGDKLVGDVFIYNWAGENDYIKIMNLAIHPNYRKLGLAEKLLNHVMQETKEYHMDRICGETRATNIGMQRTFEKCGYFLNKIEEGYYQNPEEAAYKYVYKF